MLADPDASFARALGLDVDLKLAGLEIRSKCYAMIVENGIIKVESVEKYPDFHVSDAAALLREFIDLNAKNLT